MNRWLVDTDWVIDALNGQQDAVQTLETLAPDGLAVSLITYGELYEGAYFATDSARALAALRTFLRGKDVLPLNRRVVERFARTRGLLSRPVRQQVGDFDLLIAATALVHDLTLVTRNLRDFRLVPDLKLYRPT